MANTDRNFFLWESDEKRSKSYSFGLHTGRHLCSILKFVFRKRSCLLLFILIGFVGLLQEYVIYNIGIIPSGYYKSLTEKDWDGFVQHTVKSITFILTIAFVSSFKQYISDVFYVMCRRVLTLDLQKMYFDSDKFYYINTFGYDLTDNPDQRITQDIDKFCKQFSTIVAPLLVAPFVTIYYTYQCVITTGWIGPLVILGVFIISVVANKFLIRPVMNMIIKQEKSEGFFRFKHMHVRTNAESIALQGGKHAELLRSEYRLNNLIEAQQSLYLYQLPLNMSVKLFDYIGSIISYLIIAKPLFSGKYSHESPAEIGAIISKNAFVSIYLIASFSKLIDISTSVSEIAGLTYRVSELIHLMNSTKGLVHDSEDTSPRHEFIPQERTPIALELIDVTFSSPSKKSVLVSKLNLTIELGRNILITGDSSSGKTSFIRVVKGLWPVSEGRIKYHIKFIPSNVFFLPQKPVLTDGTLFHQVLYPEIPPPYRHLSLEEVAKISELIDFVDLHHVVEKANGYDVELNWSDILTPGEAHRLSFVRLFYHKPKLAFLDEATSAVSIEMEQRLYQKCHELGITVVTVGHRDSLFRYHHKHLHFNGKGGWNLKTIDE